jgi:hypothetical protein
MNSYKHGSCLIEVISNKFKTLGICISGHQGHLICKGHSLESSLVDTIRIQKLITFLYSC